MQNEHTISQLSDTTAYLIGALITLISAISLFVFTENISIAIPASIPLGITIGLAIKEAKIHHPMHGVLKLAFIASAMIGLVILISFIIW
jgi:hypothetical protein